MGKTAFIFPGQGAQYPGMGKDFYDRDDKSREVFEQSARASGLDVAALCFEENDRLHITEFTQIAMITVEIAILRAAEERGLRASVCGGLSLGEYGAIAACGVMRDEDIFRIVRRRGIYMQEAVPEGGAMAAVLGLDCGAVEEVCSKVGGTVSIANDNCPGQIVITGRENAVAGACEQLKEAGAKRTVMLNVSGPFHSPLLSGAGEKLAETLEETEVFDPAVPYVANMTAEYVTDRSQVKRLLAGQVSSPVKWRQSVERMISDGTDLFIEMGPGRTLSGFIKKINRDVTVCSIDKYEDMEKCIDSLKERGIC